MKAFVALAALLTAAPSPYAGTFEHNEAAIVRVLCERADGVSLGTAFKITATQYLTAHHVVLDSTCYVDGQPVTILTIDAAHDFATFDGPASPAVLPVTCGGFRNGKQYLARGFAGGGLFNVTSPQIAFNLRADGFQVFGGEQITPGMSGGPLIDGRGRAVGIVNMRFPNRSMPLSSTGVCNA